MRDAWAQFLLDFVKLLYSHCNYNATTYLLFLVPHPIKRN